MTSQPKTFVNGDTKLDHHRTPTSENLTPISIYRPSSKKESHVATLSLAEEIHDEFLVCKICLDVYMNPKCLECLHTFCEHCIDNHIQSEYSYKKYSDYREFTCPLCRKRTQVPIGGVKKLPDNFLVSGLSEVVGRRKQPIYPLCDICKYLEDRVSEGTAKCLDCSKVLCQNCINDQSIKVTSNHAIYNIVIEKEIACQFHGEEIIRFYCELCEQCICVLCAFKEHRDHKVLQFSEAVTKYKTSIRNLVTNCEEKLTKVDVFISVISKCDDMLQDTRKRIMETSTEFIRQIQQAEKETLDSLDRIYGQECLKCLELKQEFVNQAETIKTTNRLAETILNGNDIEMLLLRKEVKNKLMIFKSLNLLNLPKSVGKKVEFLSGAVSFGQLQEKKKDGDLTSSSSSPDEFEDRNFAERRKNDFDSVVNPPNGKLYADKGVNTKARGNMKNGKSNRSLNEI